MGTKTDTPTPQPDPLGQGIEGMEETKLSTEELALLDEGRDVPAPSAAPEPPAPRPEPASEPARADAPAEPEPEAEPTLSERDRFLTEIRELDPDALRERLADMHKQSVGMRGAIAREKQKTRDLSSAHESLRAEFNNFRSTFQAPPPQPAAPPEPEAPPALPIKQDEQGRYYIDRSDLANVVQPMIPKPPAPDQNTIRDQAVRRDLAAIGSQSHEHHMTLTRLEQARQFMAEGVKRAAATYGHTLASADDTLRIVQAYGLDQQLAEHWPELETADLMDLMQGGRLAERVVQTFARKWYPTGVPRNGAAPLPELWENGERPAPRATEAAPAQRGATGPAPGGAPRSVLAKPRTLGATPGIRPQPASRVDQLLNASVEKLVSKHSAEFEQMADEAIRELETS